MDLDSTLIVYMKDSDFENIVKKYVDKHKPTNYALVVEGKYYKDIYGVQRMNNSQSIVDKFIHESTKTKMSSICYHYSRGVESISHILMEHDTTYLFGNHKINVIIQHLLNKPYVVYEIIKIDDWYEYATTTHSGDLGYQAEHGRGLKKCDYEQAKLFFEEVDTNHFYTDSYVEHRINDCNKHREENNKIKFDNVELFYDEVLFDMVNALEKLLGVKSDSGDLYFDFKPYETEIY